MAILQNMSVPAQDGNELTLMPKLQNRFRVLFNYSTNTSVVTGNVKSIQRPTLSFDEVTLDVYNSRIKMPGKHTWNDIELILRDDISSETVKSLEEQVNRQIDMATQSRARSAGAFKFTTQIDTLDGTNGSEPEVLDRWELVGSFISSINYGNNDYSNSETVDITVTLRYDSARHIIPGINGDDTLSGQFAQTEQAVSTGE